MQTLSERLKKARLDAGYETAGDAARAFGWNENTYRSNENGARYPGRTAILAYARALGVELEWLLTGRGTMRGAGRPTVRQVPILTWRDIANRSQTLRNILLSAEARGYVVMPDDTHLSAYVFALPIEDDSMIDPAGSTDSLLMGDKIVVDVERTPKPGSFVLARYGTASVVVRQMRVLTENPGGQPERVALVPLNPNHPTREVTIDDVVGVVAGMWRERNL